MFSEKGWKKIWLIFGVFFMFIAVFMLFFAPVLAKAVGTEIFSNRARAMISFYYIWLIIYNGIGNFLLYKDMKKYEVFIVLGVPAGFIFTILQIVYMAMGLFEFVFTEVIWAIIPSIWAILCLTYLFEKKKNKDKI